ncbi:MAG: SDR family NAD(P)-dependent oxidoreductase [Mycobacteriaceae bacterium]
MHRVVDRSFAQLGRIDVLISNAGYGLFGAAEEFTDAQVDRIIATNLTGSIQLIRSALPHLRAQGGGRIIQLSSYGGQVAFPGNSLYHATKWGIEGFVEAVAAEVAPFGIGMTIIEPGGARTEFRYGSAQVAHLTAAYDDTPAHSFLAMLDPANELAPGDPARMAARIIDSVTVDPATAAHGARFPYQLFVAHVVCLGHDRIRLGRLAARVGVGLGSLGSLIGSLFRPACSATNPGGRAQKS